MSNETLFKIKNLKYIVKTIDQTKTELYEVMGSTNFAEAEKLFNEITTLIAHEIGNLAIERENNVKSEDLTRG